MPDPPLTHETCFGQYWPIWPILDARRFLPTSAPTPLGGQNRRNRIAIGCWNTAQTRCELSVAFALEISTPGGRRLAWTQANAVPQCVTIGSAHPDLLAGGGGQRTHRALQISYNHTSRPLPDAGTMRAACCNFICSRRHASRGCARAAGGEYGESHSKAVSETRQ